MFRMGNFRFFASGQKSGIASSVIEGHLARLVLLFPGKHALFLWEICGTNCLVNFVRASGVA
jgi:hypothetical protein